MSNVTRISGFSSGLDIDSLVEQLMSTEQTKLDKLNQQQTKITWTQEEYRTVSTSLVDFRNNKLHNYSLSSAINAKQSVVTGNTSAVTATANGASSTGTMNVTVNKLATAANVIIDTGVKGSDASEALTSLNAGFSGSVTVNGQSISISATDTIQDLVDNINAKSAAKVTAIYDQTTGKISITNKTLGEGQVSLGGDFSSDSKPISVNNSVSLAAATADTASDTAVSGLTGFNTSGGTISVNGASISYSSTDTIDDLISNINSSSTANVTATYDQTTGKISLASKSGGNIQWGGDFEGLTYTSGSNAEVNINGLDMTYTSNTFTVNNVSLTLNAVSGSNGSSTVTTSTDTSKIMETIKSFISDYNTLVDKLNDELDQEVYRDYQPLTDAQREEMTDDQIELWETKAKSGLLYNDSILSSTASSLRLTSMAAVQTSAGSMSLNSIGITTGDWYDKGKLVIKDEEALMEALETNPDAVVELFTKSGTDQSVTSTSSGIFTRMSKILSTSLSSLSAKAGTSTTSTSLTASFLENSTLSEQLRNLSDSIDDEEDRLDRLEDSYYAKFTAMETAINSYNSQASAFS
ncbi:flagellar filament capping protein FliD [Paenibacillus pinistramenti]|uniref:flagellar filament capping protein FliD n=1 Tax=Paenibacillus pinistramenti TaxID=1768003 RepID=UPI001108D12B|nr:flagellar filament capping protein FliD [Paenibacillus pinistramenti]